MPITTDVVSSNLDQGEVYNIIVESGVKHHQTNKQTNYIKDYSFLKQLLNNNKESGHINVTMWLVIFRKNVSCKLNIWLILKGR